MSNLGLPELIVIAVVGLLILYPAARICGKAGFSPWLGLAAIFPGINLILLWFLALADWPSLRARS